MKRKQFISSALAGFGLLTGLPPKMFDLTTGNKVTVIPPYLKPGDVVGITCPAGYISLADCAAAIKTIEGWGFKVRIGNSVGKKHFSLGGTDEERAADLNEMLRDNDVKAIMCARGGYGIVRIIEHIDFKKLVEYPKWIIGFSDATILHSHINKNFGIATLHAKMCNSFPDPAKADRIQTETIDSIRRCLVGEKMSYTASANANNRNGKAHGALAGGNLKTLESLAGTASDITTANKILFLEDTGEYLYSIDRMFWNLKRTGKLKNLSGLIIGGFKIKADDPGEEFGSTLEQIVLEKVSEYNYPVAFDFPVGHQKNNYGLKCGVEHELNVSGSATLLNEI